MGLLCHCGEPASWRVMYPVSDIQHLRCEACNSSELDDERDVIQHETDHFDGAYGVPVVHRWPIAHIERLHARNVDKQRRRLLAERLDARWRKCEMVARSSGAAMDQAFLPEHRAIIERRRDFNFAHASKLRTIAARLRGTK